MVAALGKLCTVTIKRPLFGFGITSITKPFSARTSVLGEHEPSTAAVMRIKEGWRGKGRGNYIWGKPN
jgi:hypothetical protein